MGANCQVHMERPVLREQHERVLICIVCIWGLRKTANYLAQVLMLSSDSSNSDVLLDSLYRDLVDLARQPRPFAWPIL
jgi:hypothetical protein